MTPDPEADTRGVEPLGERTDDDQEVVDRLLPGTTGSGIHPGNVDLRYYREALEQIRDAEWPKGGIDALMKAGLKLQAIAAAALDREGEDE